jgi:prepilin-type processing-associated H-X9-DG protein
MPWGYALSPYLGHGRYKGPGPSWDSLFNGLYRCGEDHRRNEWSYGKNVWFELTSGETGEIDGVAEGPTFPRISSIRAGSSTIMFGELASGSMGDHIMAHFWYFGGQPEVDSQRHGVRSNYVFVDGHAEARVFETTFNLTKRIDLWRPGRTR